MAARGHRHHLTASRQGVHETSAFGDEIQGLFEVECAGHACRREFADAVSYDGVGCPTPVRPLCDQGLLQREQATLRIEGSRGGDGILAKQHGPQIDAAGGKAIESFIQSSTKYLFGVVQDTAHPRVLGPLARKDEHSAGNMCLAKGGALRAGGCRCRGARQPVEFVFQSCEGSGDGNRPCQVLVAASAGAGAVLNKGSTGITLRFRAQFAEREAVVRELPRKSGAVRCGHRQHEWPGLTNCTALRFVSRFRDKALRTGRRGALKHCKGVGPAHADRVDGGSYHVCCVDFLQPFADVKWAVCERNSRVRGLVVQSGGHLTVFDAQCRFDQASQTGTLLQVTKVALHRTNRAVARQLCTGRLESPAKSLNLNRIAESGGRAVAFHESYVVWVDIGEGNRLDHGSGLGFRDRCREVELSAPVVADGGASDDRMNVIAVGQRSIERF